MGETLKQRVETILVEHPEITQAELGRIAKVSKGLVSQWFSGQAKKMGYPAAKRIHDRFGYGAEWLMDGSGQKRPVPPAQVGKPMARETPLQYEAPPEKMQIPVYDVRASMGLGAPMPEQDTVVDHLRLAGTWVRRHLPTISSTLNLAVISAFGNSMSPTFNDGDILLVDRGVTMLNLDTVYVLAFNDELYIKRIQRMPDKSVRIISDNRAYDPIVVSAAERESVKVLGKVVWAWNGKTP